MAMENQWQQLLHYAILLKATDIHFEQDKDALKISVRTDGQLKALRQDIFQPALLEFLKFKAGLDLCSPMLAQSGEFESSGVYETSAIRFALMPGSSISAVIRILHSWNRISLENCSSAPFVQQYFQDLLKIEHGLVISCGPTGSGKTTTIHALLEKIAQQGGRKIVSLEDPVEIHSPRFLQLQINEQAGLTYESGIEQLMRHDPDVIFIGECRSSYTAKMAVRAALTGCLVFTTLHAGNGRECLLRLLELGVAQRDAACVLQGVFCQRLETFDQGNRKECVYECWERKSLERLFEDGDHAGPAFGIEECRAAAAKRT